MKKLVSLFLILALAAMCVGCGSSSAQASSAAAPTAEPEKAPESTSAPIAEADVIFLGFPIWWYREPSLVDSFLDAYDFSGKTIVPFFTSGGSQLGEGQERIQSLAAGAKVMNGKRFSARASEKELKDWVAGLNLE